MGPAPALLTVRGRQHREASSIGRLEANSWRLLTVCLIRGGLTARSFRSSAVALATRIQRLHDRAPAGRRLERGRVLPGAADGGVRGRARLVVAGALGRVTRAGLAGGALLTYAWHSFVQEPVVGARGTVDLIGNAVFSAGAVVVLAAAVWRVREP